jgi:hypothetical protein
LKFYGRPAHSASGNSFKVNVLARLKTTPAAGISVPGQDCIAEDPYLVTVGVRGHRNPFISEGHFHLKSNKV